MLQSDGLIHPNTLHAYIYHIFNNSHHTSSITNHTVTVIGEVDVSAEVLQLASLGTRFIPTPSILHSLNPVTISNSINQFIRRCRLTDYFHWNSNASGNSRPHHTTLSPSTPHSWRPSHVTGSNPTWLPPCNSATLVDTLQHLSTTITTTIDSHRNRSDTHTRRPQSHRHISNLDTRLHSAQHQLHDNSEVLLVDSDKGCGPVLVSKQFYLRLQHIHLHDRTTYVQLNTTSTTPTQLLEHWRQQCVDLMVRLLGMSREQALQHTSDCKLPVFRVLPKVHKHVETTLASRPIVGAFNSPSRYLSDTLLHLLAPLLSHDTWTLHSSLQLVHRIEHNSSLIPPSTTLITADVRSLYPSLHIPSVIPVVVARFCTSHNLETSSTAATTLHEMLTCVLETSFFCAHTGSGDIDLYQQTHGMSMGISVCTVVANIYVGNQLLPVFKRFQSLPWDTSPCSDPRRVPAGHVGIIMAHGYIDDIIAVVDLPPEQLQLLLQDLNNANECLKLDITTSNDSVNYLDMTISKSSRWQSSNHLQLDLQPYEKPMNNYLYIPFSSCHPRSSLIGFIAAEARRFVIISSSLEAALAASERFAQRLLSRGYPIATIVKQLSKIKYSERLNYINSSTGTNNRSTPTHQQRITPLILPYSPALRCLNINHIITEQLSRFYWINPLLAWSNNRNLNQVLKRNHP